MIGFETAPSFRTLWNTDLFYLPHSSFLPIFVGLFFKKRFPIYEGLVSLIFIILMLTGSNLKQIYALLFYVVWQILIVYSYKIYRQKRTTSGFSIFIPSCLSCP